MVDNSKRNIIGWCCAPHPHGEVVNLNTQVETEEDVWDYPAPAGDHDFHRIADRLATEHPRDMATGRWLIALRGAGEDQYYRFSWRASG